MCTFIVTELLRITRQIHCKAVEQKATLIHRQYNRDWGTSYSGPTIDPYLTPPPSHKILAAPLGKTNLDFTGARDSEWQWHQLGHMQVCTSLQTDNNASTPPLSFLQAGCPSCRPTNSVKALKVPLKSKHSTQNIHYQSIV